MYMIMRYFSYCFSSVVVLVNKGVETNALWFHALTIPLRVSYKTNTINGDEDGHFYVERNYTCVPD